MDELIATIAAVFHWPLSELLRMPFDELAHWREMAVQQWNEMQPSEGT